LSETEVQSEVPEDVRLQHVPGEAIEGKSDEAKIRAAMAESRAERGERPRDETIEWDGTPLPEPGPHQSVHSQARRAAAYMGNPRAQATAESLRTRDGYVAHLKQNPDVVWSAAIAGKSEDDLADELHAGTPPSIVNSVVDGKVLQPLGDYVKPWKLDDKDLFANVQESARAMREFREATARAENAIVEDIDTGLEAQALEQQQAEVVEQAQQAAPPPEPVQQPQPDPLAQERARLAQEQAQLSELRRVSVDELRAASQAQQWREYAYQNFPELKDQNALSTTYTKNPARFQELQKIDQHVRGLEAQAAQHRQARQVREGQIAQVQAKQADAARRQFIDGEDAKYQAWVSKAMPQYATGPGKARLNEAAHKVLRATGLTDAQIKQQWDAGYLRPLGFQQVIAQAAAHLDTQEQMRKATNRSREISNQRYRPPVTSYAAQPRGMADEELVRSLERQLESATGQKALRIATQLTQARRQLG
jgi:hypothetical protein